MRTAQLIAVAALLQFGPTNVLAQRRFTFPRPDDIVVMEAETFTYLGFLDTRLPRVRSFRVPKKRYGEISRHFVPSSTLKTWAKGRKQIGSLLIVKKDGDSYRISFYSDGDKRPLVFSVKGTVYLGPRDRRLDNAHSLDMTIRGIYEELTGHIVTRPLGQSKRVGTYPLGSEGSSNSAKGTGAKTRSRDYENKAKHRSK